MDERSPTGRMLLTMFAAIAEFERAVMLDRQRAGVAGQKEWTKLSEAVALTEVMLIIT